MTGCATCVACSSAEVMLGGAVSGYTREEVAQRAGVDPEYLDRLVELGILTPAGGDGFSPGDALRARWLQSLERAGVPLEGLAGAVRGGVVSFSFLDVGAYDRFAGLSGTTFQQLSATTGIPLELLLVVREAVGFAEPGSADIVHDHELSVVPLLQLQLSEGFRPVVIERWLRVYGDSLRRIAEAEAGWWNSEVEMALVASGMTEGEMLQAQADLGSQMTPLIDQTLLAIYHGQQEHTWSQVFVEHVEGALEAGGPAPPVGASAGQVFPRPHRVHAADRGAGGRGRRGPGGAAGHPGPAVRPGAQRDAGEVAG